MLNDQGRFGQGLSNIDPDAAGASNRRADQRHMSVFRVGKLITSRGQELCLIRNISSGGLMAHIYSPHDAQEHVEIELKAGKTVKGVVVWARDRKIGVQFDDKIDVADVLAPQPGESDQIARAPRLNLHRRGRIRLGAHYQLIEIQDISQGGAKFGDVGDGKRFLLVGANDVIVERRAENDGVDDSQDLAEGAHVITPLCEIPALPRAVFASAIAAVVQVDDLGDVGQGRIGGLVDRMVETGAAVQQQQNGLLPHDRSVGDEFGALDVEEQPHPVHDHMHGGLPGD